jgi:hypothetical protein
MGKGVGSSLTSRRIFRPGELVFVFSSDVLKSAHVFTSYLGARLLGNLVVSTWSRYFGTSFLGKSQRGVALLRETRPSVTGTEFRNTRRMFFERVSALTRRRVRRRLRRKVGRRIRGITAGLGGRLFSVELVKLGGALGQPSRVRRPDPKKALRRALPALRLQSRRARGHRGLYCRFVTPSRLIRNRPARPVFPFRTAQAKFNFRVLLGLFGTLAHARDLRTKRSLSSTRQAPILKRRVL